MRLVKREVLLFPRMVCYNLSISHTCPFAIVADLPQLVKSVNSLRICFRVTNCYSNSFGMDQSKAPAVSLDAVPASSRLSILQEHGLECTADGQYVRWSRSNPRHPRNWSKARKIWDLGLIIWVDVYTYDPLHPHLVERRSRKLTYFQHRDQQRRRKFKYYRFWYR